MGAVTSRRTVVVLGSTGSIGTQALDVLDRHRDRFRVVGLGAGGGDPAALARQAHATGADVVAVADPAAVGPFEAAWAELAGDGRTGPEVVAGADAAAQVAGAGADVVLNGVTGSLGLGPTLAALRAGSTLALANKESLVVGGALVAAAQRRPDQIVPVDSEHSAIWQCLRSGAADEVRRLVLTASGGPFRGRRRSELAYVTPAEALAHPTWSMGPVVTVNSATLMNKGLELIEAHLLFGVPVADITVVVHPQSVVHSMVEFVDGSVVAQMGFPTMELPILYALTHPERVSDAGTRFDPVAASALTFEAVDETRFPAFALGVAAGRAGGTATAVFNAANEEAVAAFLADRLPFSGVPETIDAVLQAHEARAVESLDDVLEADRSARLAARSHIDAC